MATSSDFVKRLRALSMNMARLEIAAQRCARELDYLLELATCLDGHSSPVNHPPKPFRVGRFIVDRTTFSVCDGTKICELGNTICFRFFECLASEPDRGFTREQLLAAVWDGQRRAATTVRSAIFELRNQLRDAGMADLADAIHSNGRAYSLRFDDRLRRTQRKTNGRSNANPTAE
jgi:DNA-binding response OmpR family regulator